MKKYKILTMIIVTSIAASMTAIGFSHGKDKHAKAETVKREFTVVAIAYQGAKLWIPATLIVNKGDKVKITLINKIKSDPATHGYAIDAYKIKEVTERGKPKTVQFTADKDGLFNIYCQLHPAHIGGQLLVLNSGK